MKRNVSTAILLLLIGTVCAQQPAAVKVEYFPAGTFLGDNEKLDSLLIKWDSSFLAALEEPSLFSASKDPHVHAYRFLWLRTWNKPVSIRVEQNADKTATLSLKVGTGSAGFAATTGKLDVSRTKQLSAAEFATIVAQFRSSEFWTSATRAGPRGADGAVWLFEGAKDGQYHVVDRWSPTEGQFRETGLRLLRLSGLDVSQSDIY